ncbi:MAG: hypothetical protein ACRDXX_01775 [Stackebrandtia sp.]
MSESANPASAPADAENTKAGTPTQGVVTLAGGRLRLARLEPSAVEGRRS